MNLGVVVTAEASPTYWITPFATLNYGGVHIGLFPGVVTRADPVLNSAAGLGDTFLMFHPLMFWLNADAYANMLFIFKTFSVFHVPMGWLNTCAL